MLNHNNILSIECSVTGGSLALFNGIHLLDDWAGNGINAKSEDFLSEIEKLLNKNRINNKKLGKVIISTGPGNLTGIRIGMAIGFGLRKSIDCELIGVSALEGLLTFAGSATGETRVMTALPIGKNQVCCQVFEINHIKEILKRFDLELTTFDEFADRLRNQEYSSPINSVILHNKLYRDFLILYSEEKVSNINSFLLIDAGENLARLNALRISADPSQNNNANLEIIYASNQKFVKQKI